MELEKLIDSIDQSRLPRHVAIIMDGNGRWAIKRGKRRVEGHRSGVETAKRIVKLARRLGIECLSLFAFSTENWGRPKEEVSFLMGLLRFYLEREISGLLKRGIKCVVCGDVSSLPDGTREVVEKVVERTRECKDMILALVLSYSGRWDIVQATKRIVSDALSAKIKPDEIDEELFRGYLSTAFLPYPDLLIRTSGEMRISNFFLWDIAYTELYFTQTLWPDFTEEEFLEAILDYQGRERRFGLLKSKDEYR